MKKNYSGPISYFRNPFHGHFTDKYCPTGASKMFNTGKISLFWSLLAGVVLFFGIFGQRAAFSSPIFDSGPNRVIFSGISKVNDHEVSDNPLDPNLVLVSATSGTSAGSYATLKGAFDKINDGTHQGVITIQVTGNTTETAMASLNASVLPSSYSSVTIYPTQPGITVSGNMASPLINLNGADNVTIDGRISLAGTSADLTLVNTNTSAVAGTSTIRLINDATFNTIRYCNILGASMGSEAGNIMISSTTNTSGNDNNLIEFNHITKALTGRPKNGVVAIGSSGKENNYNSIRNNQFYNLMDLSGSVSSNAILIYSYNSQYTINGNSIFEPETIIPTGSTYYSGITIANGGFGYSVTGNYIGGSSHLCGGTPMTKTAANNNTFYGMFISISNISPSSVQGNVIQNIAWSSISANFYGFFLNSGQFNFGNVTGNSIGSAEINGSIVFSNQTTGGGFTGIRVYATGNSVFSKNVISGIITQNNPVNGTYIIAIDVTGSVDYTISENLIGSQTVASSIHTSAAATTSAQDCFGIRTNCTGITTIAGNILANLTQGSTCDNTLIPGYLTAIYCTGGRNVLLSNTIRNLASSRRTDHPIALCGICINGGTGFAQTISRNTVYDITGSHPTFNGKINGIYFYGTPAASSISGNCIHSLAVGNPASGIIAGIRKGNGPVTMANNIISLGSGSGGQYYGIVDEAGTSSIYFNTVQIGGTLADQNNASAALQSIGSNNRNYRNNIFSNSRSNDPGATGTHYSVLLANNTNLIMDYNDLWVSGIGGMLCSFNNMPFGNLASWQSYTGLDLNSLQVLPGFSDQSGSSAQSYLPSHPSLIATPGTGITTDFDSSPRSNVYPSMGAWEYPVNPCTAPTSGGTVAGDQAICANSVPDPFTSSVGASGGSGSIEYQWQFSSDGNTFTSINGATTDSYSPGALVTETWFRRLARAGCISDWITAVSSNIIHISILPGHMISGTVRYYNNPLTPLDLVMITLKKEGLVQRPPIITTSSGYYAFEGLENGIYDLEITTAHPSGQWQTWGGVNNTDYLLVSRHANGIAPLQVNPPVVLVAANVKPADPLITVVDANAVRNAAKYGWFMPGTSTPWFDTPKWVFSGSSVLTPITGISIECGDLTRHIYGLCAGDVNGSYLPPSGYKTEEPRGHGALQLVCHGTLPITPEITFPVRAGKDMEIGAMTLMLNYDPRRIEITGVEMIDKNGEEPYFLVNGNQLHIGWISLDPVRVNEGQTLLLIHTRLTTDNSTLSFQDSAIRFIPDSCQISELANGYGEVIEGAKLSVADARVFDPAEPAMISLFPNPASDRLIIEFLMPICGDLTIDIINLHGNSVRTFQQSNIDGGLFTTTFDVSDLPPGIYPVRIKANGQISIKKVVITR